MTGQRRKLTAEQRRAMVDDYVNNYDQNTMSSKEFAAKYGVTPTTLYDVLKAEGVTPKKHQTPQMRNFTDDEMGGDMAREALSAIMDKLVTQGVRIKVLESALQNAGVALPNGH